MLLPRAQGLPQPPGADQHLRQDGPQGASTSPSKTTLIMLIGTARPGHPRRDDRSRHIHPRRRQQDTLRGRVRRRSGVNQKPPRRGIFTHIASDLAIFDTSLCKRGKLCPHPHTHESTPHGERHSHCNIFFVYVKKGWRLFFGDRRLVEPVAGVPGFREGWFRWASRAWQRASERAQSSRQHRAANVNTTNITTTSAQCTAPRAEELRRCAMETMRETRRDARREW